MRFLQVWLDLSPGELARLLLPVALLAIAIFLPGRRTVRFAALAVAGSLLLAEGLAPEGGVRLFWVAIWVAIAWAAQGHPTERRPVKRPGGLESWTIGLPLGLVFLALLVVAVARASFEPAVVRSTTLGVALIGIGLLHLMLRRDVLRALLAFGALGMGLQALDHTAHGALLPHLNTTSSSWAIPAATTLSLAMVARLAYVRRQDAGTAWVSDAHDLHD